MHLSTGKLLAALGTEATQDLNPLECHELAVVLVQLSGFVRAAGSAKSARQAQQKALLHKFENEADLWYRQLPEEAK